LTFLSTLSVGSTTVTGAVAGSDVSVKLVGMVVASNAPFTFVWLLETVAELVGVCAATTGAPPTRWVARRWPW
jgi:hypothetical protein